MELLDTSKMTEMQPVYPQDRPEVTTPEPRQMLAPETIMKMPVDMLVDMEICDMVNDRKEISKTARRTKRAIWDKCWQNFKGVYDKTGKAPWQSTTFFNLTSKTVEVVLSNMHGAMLGPDVPVEYQTRRPDMDQQIRSINELIQVDLEKCDYKAHLTDFMRTALICGTAVGEVGYLKQEETVMIKQRNLPSPIDGQLQSMGIDTSKESFIPKRMLVKDYATITNVDLYDVYPQPRIAEFGKDSWVVVEGKITNRELVMGSRDADPYYRMDNVTDDLLAGSGLQRVDQNPEKQVRRYALLDYFTANHFLDPDREHRLDTFYGQIPIWYLKPELRNDKARQYDSVPGWIQVVDGQFVIRKRISPWRDGEPPYFKGNYIRIPGEFYGIGVAEIVMGLQVEKNEIRNSRMDNVNLSMNKIIAVLKDMVPKGEWDRLVSEPGAIWAFKGVDDVRKAIQVIEFGDETKDSWMASQEIDQETQEESGAVKATLGVQGGPQDTGGSTFRGAMLNKSSATERFMLYARMMEIMGFKKAISKFYHRIYQFKSYQDAQDTLGGTRAQNFQFISPEDLEKMAKLVPLGVMTMENKGVKLAQMGQFHQEWAQAPFLKQLEMARKEWVEMGFPEPDTVLFSDEEMKQYTQFHQMLLQQQQNPGGMPGMGGSGQVPGMPVKGPQNAPRGLVGPNGRPLTGNRAGVPGGQPVAGNVPGPNRGMPRPAIPARGPGQSMIDVTGRPLS